MLLSSSQGLLAEWDWEDGEQDLVDSDEDESEEPGLNLKRKSCRLERNEIRVEVIAEEKVQEVEEEAEEEEEEEEEEEVEFQPQRKLWSRTDTSTTLPLETQGSTTRVSALLDDRPHSESREYDRTSLAKALH
jgi:hypothetical protein